MKKKKKKRLGKREMVKEKEKEKEKGKAGLVEWTELMKWMVEHLSEREKLGMDSASEFHLIRCIQGFPEEEEQRLSRNRSHLDPLPQGGCLRVGKRLGMRRREEKEITESEQEIKKNKGELVEDIQNVYSSNSSKGFF